MHEVMTAAETAAGIVAIAGVWALAIWTSIGDRRWGKRLKTGGAHSRSHAPNDRLPPRYRTGAPVDRAPMPAADLVYDDEGQVAWDRIWSDFCDLAWAGGPPHRLTTLTGAGREEIASNRAAYDLVMAELERGLTMITRWPVRSDLEDGVIGLVCPNPDAADWLWNAIKAENIDVCLSGRRTLLLPAGPSF